jgi:hypothetical protein
MQIKIEANGSKFLGEPPDSLETLHERLKRFPLDPKFERYGNFVCELGLDAVELWGNFYTISAVFRIVGPRDELASTIDLIRQNQERPDYRAARAELVANLPRFARTGTPGAPRPLDPTPTHGSASEPSGLLETDEDHVPDEVSSDPELWFDICNDPAIWPENKAAAYRAALRGERNWRYAFEADGEEPKPMDPGSVRRNSRPSYLRRVK